MSEEQVYALPGAKESYERQQQQLAAQAQTGAGQDGAGGEEKVRASHLLIKHKDSRRPASWKNVSSFSPLKSEYLVLIKLMMISAQHHDAEIRSHHASASDAIPLALPSATRAQPSLCRACCTGK